MRRGLRSLVVVVLGTLGGLALLVVLAEDRFIYFPTGEGPWDLPSLSGGLVEDVWLPTADGLAIHGWLYAPAAPTRRTLLFLHGNAGNLALRHGVTSLLASLPARVLVIDYRGYGCSPGVPGEEGLYRDAEAAWRYLTETAGVDPGSLVVVGESLGGAVACELALRRPCAGLVLQSTFTSVADMADLRFAGLPLGFLCRSSYATAAKVGRLRMPLLVVHGEEDDLIPCRMGRALAEAGGHGATLVTVPGAGHNDMWGHWSDVVGPAVTTFCERVVPD